MKPICMKCHMFFRPLKNGYYFTEGMPADDGVARPLPGLVEAERWVPSKFWQGDTWECRGRGAEIIVGVGHEPMGLRHEEGFEQHRRNHGADQFQVNDC